MYDGTHLYSSDPNNSGGWIVRGSSTQISITSPTSAPVGTACNATYASQVKFSGGENSNYYGWGPKVNFTVSNPPPPKPVAAPGPAFSWQGSVAGVNTGNGNKLTSVPLVGWTMRGGMPVSCALYHNSQGTVYGPTDPYGNKWQLSYFTYIAIDSSGNGTATLHWDNGLTYKFTLNHGNYIPDYGILDTLVNNGNGKFTLTTPDKTQYLFNLNSNTGQPGSYSYLTSITDLDGNTLTINHYSNKTISSVVDTANRTLTFGYDGTGRLASITDPLSRLWTFTYDGAAGTGNLWYILLPPVNSQAYSISFAYDANHDITIFQNPGGHQASFSYNANGSLAWAKDALGNQTSFTYDSSNTVITDPNGHTLTHAYAASQLASVMDALGKMESYSYDYNNILGSKTDKRGHTWSYTSHFSSGNNVSTSADAMSPANSSSVTYDSDNKPTLSTDAIGNTTLNTYSTDGHEDLLSVKVTGTGASPFTATSATGGYANGLPTTFTDAMSNSSSVVYDSNGWGFVTSVKDANNHTTSATYNALGWKLTATDGLTHTTTYTYDNWGRVTDVKAPDNTHTSLTYDPDGNTLTVKDANNHTVTNVYDADDRLTQTTNGRGDVVMYAYDATGQKGLLSSKTDGNTHTTYYTYTARNEPSTTAYADSTSESVTYDENGNVHTRAKADGSVIQYAYDNDNRLTDITYPHTNTPNVHFDYDADSRRVSMTDGTGTTQWQYTDGLHLKVLLSPVGGVSYWYDADSRRATLEGYVNGLGDVSYWNSAYYPGGELYTLQSTTNGTTPLDGTTTYLYDAADRLTQKTKGNGEYETYAYDSADQLTGLGFYWPDTTLRNSLTYTYDNGGNVQTCDQGYYKTTYVYNGADQLLSETGSGAAPPPNLIYSYDHNGNRLGLTQNGSSVQSFTYDAHDKIASALNETDHYDANGNETQVTLSGITYTLTYDDEDRLIAFTSSAGVSNTFTYNGLGLRVGKIDSTGTFHYLCDGASPGSDVLWDGFAVYTAGLSEHRGSVSRYYDYDRLGNLWTVDSTTGKGQAYYQDTTGFGTLTASTGSTGTPFKFGGENGCLTDADTGLVLMGYRYYDTRTGRFISQDPIGDGDNWYAYANNNPTNEIDPEGLFADPNPSGYGNPFNQLGGGIAAANETYSQVSQLLTCYTDTKTFEHEGSTAWVQISDTGWVAQWSIPWDSEDEDSTMGWGIMGSRKPGSDPIDPNAGHKPQGTGNKWGPHTDRRAGDNGNAGFGQRAYDKNPLGKRELARRAAAAAEKAAKEAARMRRAAELLQEAEEAQKKAEQARETMKALSVLDELSDME